MNSNDVKWKIYIIGHKKIHDDLMAGDDKFNNDNYCFLNVGQLDKLDNSSQYCCLNQKDLVNYIPIGKFWAESEGSYNIWRSGIYKNLDYIGFLHFWGYYFFSGAENIYGNVSIGNPEFEREP